jgi:hypothetical protein
VSVGSAIVSVPVRTPPGFAATSNATVPLPLPLAPDVIVSQEALLVAVQVHPLIVVTSTLCSVCTPAPTCRDVGLITDEHA